MQIHLYYPKCPYCRKQVFLFSNVLLENINPGLDKNCCICLSNIINEQRDALINCPYCGVLIHKKCIEGYINNYVKNYYLFNANTNPLNNIVNIRPENQFIPNIRTALIPNNIFNNNISRTTSSNIINTLPNFNNNISRTISSNIINTLPNFNNINPEIINTQPTINRGISSEIINTQPTINNDINSNVFENIILPENINQTHSARYIEHPRRLISYSRPVSAFEFSNIAPAINIPRYVNHPRRLISYHPTNINNLQFINTLRQTNSFPEFINVQRGTYLDSPIYHYRNINSP